MQKLLNVKNPKLSDEGVLALAKWREDVDLSKVPREEWTKFLANGNVPTDPKTFYMDSERLLKAKASSRNEHPSQKKVMGLSATAVRFSIYGCFLRIQQHAFTTSHRVQMLKDFGWNATTRIPAFQTSYANSRKWPSGFYPSEVRFEVMKACDQTKTK